MLHWLNPILATGFLNWIHKDLSVMRANIITPCNFSAQAFNSQMLIHPSVKVSQVSLRAGLYLKQL